MSQRQSPKHLQPIVRFWWSDASLTFLLIILFLVLFVILPMHAVGMTGAFLIDVFFSLLVVSGVFAVATRPLTAALAAVLAVVTLALHWTRLATASEGLEMTDAIASLSMLALLATVVMMQVFREGPITIQRIQGAVCAYVLIGMMFAIGYKTITLFVPKAFNIETTAGPQHPLNGDLAYFSFVTLTTLGYGDIVAVHPAARALAILEALIGQLFPAILIARLVSLEIQHRELRREGRDHPHTDAH